MEQDEVSSYRNKIASPSNGASWSSLIAMAWLGVIATLIVVASVSSSRLLKTHEKKLYEGSFTRGNHPLGRRSVLRRGGIELPRFDAVKNMDVHFEARFRGLQTPVSSLSLIHI